MDSIRSLSRQYEEGETVIVVLDCSGSMNEDDWKPSRLQGAKDACVALLDEKIRKHCTQDRVGVVSFGHRGHVIHKPVPVGIGFGALRQSIFEIKASGGTNIAVGLSKAERLLLEKNKSSERCSSGGLLGWLLSPPDPANDRPASAGPSLLRSRIILLSDGQNATTVQDPRIVADRLKEKGGDISCIGIGGEKRVVDEALLREIASRDERNEPRYRYIGDKHELIGAFRCLATGLRAC